MTVPVWVLLGFAGWTVLTLLGSIGVYRWSLILTGRADLNEFPGDRPHGADWYRRAMRAHANCVENLPVYAALVIAINASGVTSTYWILSLSECWQRESRRRLCISPFPKPT